jgi:hypothetical protein
MGLLLLKNRPNLCLMLLLQEPEFAVVVVADFERCGRLPEVAGATSGIFPLFVANLELKIYFRNRTKKFFGSMPFCISQ